MDKFLAKLWRQTNKLSKSRRFDKKARRRLARKQKAIRQGNWS